jgi:hypothetical protein
MRKTLKRYFAYCIVFAIISCSWKAQDSDSPPSSHEPAPTKSDDRHPVDPSGKDGDLGYVQFQEKTITIDRQIVTRIQPHKNRGFVALLEEISENHCASRNLNRSLVWLDHNLHEVGKYSASGWELADFATHPSGDVSVLLTKFENAVQYKLVRLREQAIISEFNWTNSNKLGQQLQSFDIGKVAAIKEDAIVVARWSNGSIAAYRISLKVEVLYLKWEQQISAPSEVTDTCIMAEYVNFNQDLSFLNLTIDVDSDGTTYIGYFSELTDTMAPAYFDRITKLSGDGKLHFLAAVNYSKSIYKIRARGGKLAIFGRVRSDGPRNWNAFIDVIDSNSGTTLSSNIYKLKKESIFLDGNFVGEGTSRFLVVGSDEYTQNPNGASVSDSRSAIALIVTDQGTVEKEIPLPQQERGNEGQSLLVLNDHQVAIVGMLNGPGSHPHLKDIWAHGFVRIGEF